jgi:hypothetical protein
MEHIFNLGECRAVIDFLDTFNSSSTRCSYRSYLNNYFKWIKINPDDYIKSQKDFGKDVSFYFGISDSKDLEKWNKGIIFLDDWTYFDDKEKKLGWINIFGRSKKFSKTQWIVHYLLK